MLAVATVNVAAILGFRVKGLHTKVEGLKPTWGEGSAPTLTTEYQSFTCVSVIA